MGALTELNDLTSELQDRFGPLPEEVDRIVAAAKIRILGRRLAVERVLATTDTARVNFRRGAIPRLTALREALSDREVEVEVSRLQPLSLVFRTPKSQNVTPIVIEALERLAEEQTELVPTG